MRAKEFVTEGQDKAQAVRRIQKMLNDRFDANLDVDGVLGPLTQKSINRFMPSARPAPADDPSRTTAVQGRQQKNKNMSEEHSNDTAISLSRLGKFHPGEDTLAEFVPKRATARYALHPEKWESTFYSLTNKDSDKLKYYGPKKISIPPGTLVGDMAIANKFYRAKTPEEKQQYAELYQQSLKPYPVDVSQYRMPELLIPQQTAEEQQLDELSFLGSQCTKDCSGHRAGYDWSKRKGLRQANSWSPSFNKGAGLAVAGK